MPTLVHGKVETMETATVAANNRPEPIDFRSLEPERFVSECPSSFGPDGFTPVYLLENVIDKKQELLFFTLDELNALYFNDSKLRTLARLCHDKNKNDNKNISLKNCSFYVTIGMKEAYETEFGKQKLIKNSSEPASICLKTKSSLTLKTKSSSTSRGSTKRNYEEVFVDFFNQMFLHSEAEKLENTYQKANLLTICIFARECHTTKTNLTKYIDQMIGAASFVMDELDSVLVSWLGVAEKTLAELNIHDSHKDDDTSLRKHFNIGTFLLILCQVFKSTLQKKWCTVVCQVHGVEEHGPLNFYRKNFFLQTTEMNQIVYSQLLYRKDSIIYDDTELVWMVLLYPLNDLLMTIVDKQEDWNSYYLILIRGYFYFLNRNRNSLQQGNIESYIQSYCNDNEDFYKEGCSLKIDKEIVDDTESFEKFLDEKEVVKPTILSAGNNVLQTLIDEVNKHNQSELALLDCGSGIDTTDNNSLFLAVSKIIYGSSHYYINLRLFLSFYYRSVSKLSRKHPFYTNDDVDMMILEVLERLYDSKIPKSVYLPGSDQIVDPARYRKILYRLSEYLMKNHAVAEYHDIYLLASMFGVEFIVIEGRSRQFTIADNVRERDWQINFQRSFNGNQFINNCLVKVNPRPKQWLVCMFESQFMPIIQNNTDAQFDDITFMIPTVGLLTHNNDESNLIVLSQDNKIPDSDLLKDLYRFLVIKPFKIIKSLQKMFNTYRHNTEITKYKKKGKHCIPGLPNKEYGDVMTCSDFKNAGVPDEYVLGCLRCLDPPQILVENNFWPISNECQFTDLMHLRKDTWLNETCTKMFIDYLSSQNDRYFFLDPATFNNSVTQSATLMKLIATRKYEEYPEKDIIILFHIKDHFIVVEIRRSLVWEKLKLIESTNVKGPKLVKTPVFLACSLGQELSSLIEQVEERHLELLLNSLFERGEYEYKIAEHVKKQNHRTANECGVLCLQRLYKYAFFDDVSVELPDNLQSPIAFRCFILYKILEFRRNDVSPFVLYNKEKYQQFLPMVEEDRLGISEDLLRAVDQEYSTTTIAQTSSDNEDVKADELTSRDPMRTIETLPIGPDNQILSTEIQSIPAHLTSTDVLTSDDPTGATELVFSNNPRGSDSPIIRTEIQEQQDQPIPIATILTTEDLTGTTEIQVFNNPSGPDNQTLSEYIIDQLHLHNLPSVSDNPNDQLPPRLLPENQNPTLNYQEPSSPPNIKSLKRKVASISQAISITQADDDTRELDSSNVQQPSIINKEAASSKISQPLRRKVLKRKVASITQADDDLNDTDDDNDDTASTVTETYDNKTEDDRKIPAKKTVKERTFIKKPPPEFVIRIPTRVATPNNKSTIRRASINSKTPTRVSARIQSRVLSPSKTTVPRKLTASNNFRNPRLPKNYAIGFTVSKKPNTLTPATKKQLQKINEKKENINARIALYDELQDCNIYTDPDDSDNVVDLFENDEWYFLDKQLLEKQLTDPSMSLEDKHKPEIFLPLLYEPFQHSTDQAEEVVRDVILPKYKKAEDALKDADTKLNKLLKKFGERKNKEIEKAREAYQQASIKLEMLKWEMTGQKLFLPYDSIHAIQAVPSKYFKGEYDYYAVTDNPDGNGFAKKMVSKVWLDEHIDAEFMSKVDDWKGNNGWITFSPLLNEYKVISEHANFKEALRQYNIRPIYDYKPLREDDEFLIVRCEVIYDRYDIFTKVKKMRWTVLTLKESFSLTPTKVRDLPIDPLEIDKDGNRLHNSIYSNISKDLLCSIIGCEFVFLLETASVLCGQKERKRPFQLSNAPKFSFADDFESTNKLVASSGNVKDCKSSVTLDSTKTRMYDEKDLLPKNQRHCMPLQFVGDFSQPQFYYYDMREFTKRYYVHCVSTQISGIYFDEGKNKFFGLCKKESTKQEFFVHHIELEDDWVEENFPEEFLQLVKTKSKKDQRKFIKLPIGKAKPISSPACNLSNPIIKFMQNGKDNCVFASIASALSYMGFSLLAELVMKFEKQFVQTQYTNDTYSSVMGRANHKIGSFRQKDFNQKYQLSRIRNHDEFDLIETATKNPNILYHVVLVGSDGSENHCVCVFNNYIFDGNYTHAWKLQQSSLDECIDSTFIGINDGYMHIPKM